MFGWALRRASITLWNEGVLHSALPFATAAVSVTGTLTCGGIVCCQQHGTKRNSMNTFDHCLPLTDWPHYGPAVLWCVQVILTSQHWCRAYLAGACGLA